MIPPIAGAAVPAAVVPVVVVTIKIVIPILPIFAGLVAIILPVLAIAVAEFISRSEPVLQAIAPLLRRAIGKLTWPLKTASRAISETRQKRGACASANRARQRAAAAGSLACGQLTDSWALADSWPIARSWASARTAWAANTGADTCTWSLSRR